jgi:hypothetical protein
MKTECDRPIGESEMTIGPADGQRNSTLTVGQWVKAIGRLSTKGSVNKKKEGANQGVTLEGKHSGGGSIHDWQRVKCQFLGILTPRESIFYF